MAGWIEPEADVEELFEAIPQLEAVYAWDAERQRFLAAYAGSPQPHGNLTKVAPGMGLWLRLDGDEPVSWTRAASPDPSAGLVSLSEGWNLVAWTGSDGASFGDAFAALDDDLQVALAWDTEARVVRSSTYPDSPSAAALVTTHRQARRGDGFWLEVSEERYWLQPGSVEPDRSSSTAQFTEERQGGNPRREPLRGHLLCRALRPPRTRLSRSTSGQTGSPSPRRDGEVLGIPEPSFVICAV